MESKDPGEKKSFFKHIPSLLRVFGIVFNISKSVVILQIVSALFNSILPVATAFLIARITTKLAEVFTGSPEATKEVIILAVISTALALGSTLWRSLENYAQGLSRFKIEKAVEDMMYEKYLSLDFWRYDDKYTNDLKERASRFSRFFSNAFDRLSSMVESVISLVIAISAMSFVSPLIAVIILIAMAPATILQFHMNRFTEKHWKETVSIRRKQVAIEWVLTEARSIIETRIYGLVKYFMGERDTLRTLDEGARITFEKKYLKWQFLADVLEHAASLFSLIWIIVKIAQKIQPIGQFVYVQSLTAQTIGSINRFTHGLSRIDEDFVNLKDYDEFINLPIATRGNKTLSKELPDIELKQVHFSYPHTNKKILHDISLSIPAGTHLAIVGENGAGKTTLIKLILGVYEPTAGSIEVNGEALKNYAMESWHEKIGILFQDFKAFDFATIKENVWFGRVNKKSSMRNIDEALRRAHAYEFVQKLSKKEDTLTSTLYDQDENGIRLSGGQWQRLVIARNFFRDAQILILDEPTSAIDARGEAQIFDEVNKEMKNKTVIIISHRFSTVRKADKIIVLNDGMILENGTHAELMEKNGMYKEMFELQAKEYLAP